MKNKPLLLTSVMLILAISSLAQTHTIGESFGGGIVFYIYDNGQHGLIAATNDQSEKIKWENTTTTRTNAVKDGIGDGMNNTKLIIASQGTGNYAAYLCANYRGGNYTDWYLPSKGELDLLYFEKQVVGGFTFADDEFPSYWSSTEFVSPNVRENSAWNESFDDNDGFQGATYASSLLHVRAIRAF